MGRNKEGGSRSSCVRICGSVGGWVGENARQKRENGVESRFSSAQPLPFPTHAHTHAHRDRGETTCESFRQDIPPPFCPRPPFAQSCACSNAACVCARARFLHSNTTFQCKRMRAHEAVGTGTVLSLISLAQPSLLLSLRLGVALLFPGGETRPPVHRD